MFENLKEAAILVIIFFYRLGLWAKRSLRRGWRAFRRRKIFSLPNLAILGIAAFVVMGLFILWAATLELPDLSGVEQRKVLQSTKIYDRTGQVLLYDLSTNVTRTKVPITSMSPFIQEATVALEDRDFYQHYGIKPVSFLRAVLANITSLSFSQGGSTITQQVIKNSLLTQAKTPARKLKEWVLAVKLEKVLTKKQILEIYLNESPYGGSIYGVEEAARAFFGKSAADLSLAESAYLASLPQAPTYYSPNGNHRDALDRRKNLALDNMLSLDLITKQEHDQAVSEDVVFAPPREGKIKAPHFVFYVREILEEKYGASMLEGSGLRIITTLDADIQLKGEALTKKYALANAKKFNATNASIVAIDPRNGEILSMIGSRDYFDTEIPGNYNIAIANRQPGSAFKPFVYAAAFNKGYTSETVVFDLRTQFSTNCKPEETTNSKAPCYSPVNYDGVFRGPVTLRQALSNSLNIPAIKVLYLAGINASLSLAKSMGITTLTNANQYGLTLVLGGGEVHLLDMVSAYGGFATGGQHFAPNPILRIEDSSGRVLENTEPSGTQVLPNTTASEINDVLSDNVARAPAFGSDSSLNFPGLDVAAKTGTTNDYRDAWVIGYTPNLVVGAWAGNNDNTPMLKKVAGFIVAPMWHEFMVLAMKNRPTETFTRSDRDISSLPPTLRGVWQGGQSGTVDTRTGLPSDETTPPEFIGQRAVGGVHEILYWIDKNNPTGPRPVNPASDPQYAYWELPVRAWAGARGYGDSVALPSPSGSQTSSSTPTIPGTVQGSGPIVNITNPASGATVSNSAPLTITAQSAQSISQIRYYFNSQYVGSATVAPYSITVVPSAVGGNVGGSNSIRAEAVLSNGSTANSEVTFTLN